MCNEALKRYYPTIISCFKEEFLRIPAVFDVARLLEQNEAGRFPSIPESNDCMHWMWKTTILKNRDFTREGKQKQTTILEDVTDKDI